MEGAIKVSTGPGRIVESPPMDSKVLLREGFRNGIVDDHFMQDPYISNNLQCTIKECGVLVAVLDAQMVQYPSGKYQCYDILYCTYHVT